MSRDGELEEHKLFVSGLSWSTDESSMEEYFSKFGEIVHVNIKKDQESGASRGFGFVQFADADAMTQALQTSNHYINNKKVDVKRAKSNAAPGGARPKIKKIFVGGLDPSVGEEELMSHFGQYGEIEEVAFPIDKSKNKRRHFAFVIFKDAESLTKCMHTPRQKVGPNECDIKVAVPRDQAPVRNINPADSAAATLSSWGSYADWSTRAAQAAAAAYYHGGADSRTTSGYHAQSRAPAYAAAAPAGYGGYAYQAAAAPSGYAYQAR